jgi:hypothetical protein
VAVLQKSGNTLFRKKIEGKRVEKMNGPNTMYRMRPIIKFKEELELPKCMYRMKNIQQAYLNDRVERQLSNETKPPSISEQVKKLLKVY